LRRLYAAGEKKPPRMPPLALQEAPVNQVPITPPSFLVMTMV
jgi:hypothetical protein